MAHTIEFLILIFYIYISLHNNSLDKNVQFLKENYIEHSEWIIDCATYAKPNFGEERLQYYLLSPTNDARKSCEIKLSRSKVSSHSLLSCVVLMLSGDISTNPGPDDNIQDHFQCFKKKGLHLLHLNTRSLLNKVDEVHALAVSTNAAVLGVSETWLDETITDAEVNITGYVLERRDRRRDGGGVCVYIRKDIVFNRHSELETEDMEFLAIDVILPKTKPILIGMCYRPPKDNNFYNKLETQLSNSPHFVQQEMYLLGDFNTDVSTNSNTGLNKSLKNFMKMFGFFQIINSHTRITSTSASTIDLIVVSDVDRVSQSGVIPCSFSDHDIIFCTRKLDRGFFNKHNVVNIRSMKTYDSEVFKGKLKSLNWSDILDVDNVNLAWSMFSNMFKKVIEEVAPIREIRAKQRSQLWFTGEVRDLIQARDQAHSKFRQTKNNEDYLEFKKLRNLTQHKIQSLKRDFILNQLNENQSYPKKLWSSLKQLGMPTKSKSSSSQIGLKCENSNDIIFESKTVANKFNKFFCNIAAKLVKKLKQRPFDNEKITEFYKEKGVIPNAFSLSNVSIEIVRKQLASLNVTKSTGCDGIAARFLKDAADVIATPIAHIINLSLKTGTVPKEFKTARVVPLYKKGDRSQEGNYRPVSILPIVSKVFERLVHDQLYQYLCNNSLIYEFQSGFRPMFSTDTALTYLGDKIRFNMDKGLFTGVVLLDLQKAFDTVDHSILISKLRAIGADNIVIKWFSSYLCDRKQFVDIHGTYSSEEEISCGVPQGSILGPLLFTMYVNDMSSAVTCDLCLYADDSMLLVRGKDVKQLERILENEMNEISKWLQENRLSLHLGKTESILFGTKHRLKKVSQMDITCNNVKIEAKSSVKYLGVTLDQDISGKTMGDNVVKKINSVLKFLYRKNSYLKYNHRKLLSSALIQSRFDYGYNIYYRGLGKDVQKKLQTAQNKMIRFILDYDSRHHLCVKDFVKTKYLSVGTRIDYLSLNMMYNIYNNRAPSYLCHFQSVTNVHSHRTRNSAMSYVIPRVKKHGSETFMFNGAKLWNKLPDSIKSVTSKDSFKTKCKDQLFQQMEKIENCQFIY